MKIAATHLCRCGHKACAHTQGVFTSCDVDDVSTLKNVIKNSAPKMHKCASNCAKFELPNLDLIEYLAKERGLI